MSEKEYNDLYQYTVKAAYRYIGYQDAAFDLAQNAILSFITSKSSIESPEAWIRVVLRREAAKFFDQQHYDRELGKRYTVESSTNSSESAETDRILSLDNAKLKKILNAADLEIFNKLKKAKFSVQNYAAREDIPRNTAKNHKMRIKRNVLAHLLWEDGWRTGTKILNYGQYYNIQRFINTIIDAVKNNTLKDMIHYTGKVDQEEIFRVFGGVRECLEWTVSFKDNLYPVFLVCMDQDLKPKFCQVFIKFAAKNTINIVKIRTLKGICEGPGSLDALTPYMVKGKLELTEEEYINRVRPLILDSP